MFSLADLVLYVGFHSISLSSVEEFERITKVLHKALLRGNVTLRLEHQILETADQTTWTAL